MDFKTGLLIITAGEADNFLFFLKYDISKYNSTEYGIHLKLKLLFDLY